MTANRAISAVIILLSGVGVAISGYLTSVHYSDVELVCTSGGIVSCEQVLTSSYASVLGIPWAVGGIAWFGVAALLSATALLSRPEPAPVQPMQVVWSLIGIATVVYLIGVELTAVDKICLWCTAMHVIIGAIFVLHLLREPETESALEGAAA